MHVLRPAVPTVLFLLLAGCGGGGSGSVVTPTAPAPGTTTLAVTLSAASQSATTEEDGAPAPIGFDATVGGTASDPVIADIQFDRNQLALQSDITKSGSAYQVRLKSLSGLAPGSYSGTVTFRLCRDAGCTNVYPGSTQNFTYQLAVRLADWSMFQRNPAHTGYVRATFDPAKFSKAWEWTQPTTNRVTPIASANGLVYTTTFGTDGTTTIRALSSSTGAEQWLYSLGSTSYTSGPAVANGRLSVTSMVSSSDNNTVVTIDAASGKFIAPNAPFSSQWSFFLPPVPYGDKLYISAGYYGNFVYGYDYKLLTYWGFEAKDGKIWDGETPAVDEGSVYYYSGTSMNIIDRETGSAKATYPDPFFQSNSYSYYGAPILGSMRNVLAYSGHRGSASPSVLVDWSIASGYVWRSADSYVTTPAVGGGSVYLARNDAARLDSLDEATGAVQWSWTPPSGERFIGNTVATQTLVFVSTDRAVYALPITGSSHAPLWSAPTGGEMAITSDGLLVVAYQPPGGWTYKSLAAYRLK
jgi:hypothetical protein